MRRITAATYLLNSTLPVFPDRVIQERLSISLLKKVLESFSPFRFLLLHDR